MDAGVGRTVAVFHQGEIFCHRAYLVMTALPGSAARAAFVGAAYDQGMTGPQKIISRAALGQRLAHADLP